MKRTTVLLKKQVFNEKNTTSSVMQLLFRFPQKVFSLTELARETKTSKSTISRAVPKLHKREAILVEKAAGGQLFRIKLNTQNKTVIREKMLFNIAAVCRSGLVDFLEKKYGHPRSIVLFGSFRKGGDMEESDVDIAVELSEKIEFRKERLKELEKLENGLNRKIVIHLFNREKVDLDLFNSIANGIVLSGFLEVGL